jgi:hypothetical protein
MYALSEYLVQEAMIKIKKFHTYIVVLQNPYTRVYRIHIL